VSRRHLVLFMAIMSLGTTSAAAASTSASAIAVAKATVLKPLALLSVQNLDLGSILLASGGVWSGVTVGISRSEVFSCSGGNVACFGATQVAKFRVAGSNNQALIITAPNVILTNATDPTKTLTLVVDSPASVTLTNSGNQGVEFAVGGFITLNSSTASGDYSGTLEVTVNYN